jgi:hypothetical protein
MQRYHFKKAFKHYMSSTNATPLVFQTLPQQLRYQQYQQTLDLQRVNSTNPTSFKMTPIPKSIWKKSFWGSVKECFTFYGPSPFANCPSHMF